LKQVPSPTATYTESLISASKKTNAQMEPPLSVSP
jgi:hypothetical protein